jgi:hypothetical protein
MLFGLPRVGGRKMFQVDLPFPRMGKPMRWSEMVHPGRWGWIACLLLAWPTPFLGQTTGSIDPAGAGLPLYRPSGSVAVLAVATEDWAPVPTDPHDLLGDFAFLPPYATDDTEGQVFSLLLAEAGRTVADANDRFVAVPWTVGCGCAEEGWDQPDWVEPGDTVAFLLSVTRQRVPWDGPPVYDVLGWHQPYPSGDFIPYWRIGREEPKDWLSPLEFFGLLEVLPFREAFELDPKTSLRAVRKWVSSSPERARAYPVSTILQTLAGG